MTPDVAMTALPTVTVGELTIETGRLPVKLTTGAPVIAVELELLKLPVTQRGFAPDTTTVGLPVIATLLTVTVPPMLPVTMVWIKPPVTAMF